MEGVPLFLFLHIEYDLALDSQSFCLSLLSAWVAGYISVLSADGIVTKDSGTVFAIVWFQDVLKGPCVEGSVLSWGEVEALKR